MKLSERFWRTAAFQILAKPDTNEGRQDAILRRAVSSLYYGIFHRLTEDAAYIIAPNLPVDVHHRLQRWFEHGSMKQTCERFLQERLEQPVLGLVGTVPEDLQTVCRTFIELQEARHSADYDPDFILNQERALQLGEFALRAIEAWERVGHTAQANIFVLSLLARGNWKRDRK